MRAVVVGLLLLGASSVRADDGSAAQARQAEERAFAAVEKEQWCDALGYFVEAHRLAPTPEMLFNAAHAAELGEDRARAVQLYTELLGSAPAAGKAEARKKLAALMKVVEKKGSGAACLPPVAPIAAASPSPSSSSSPSQTTPGAAPTAPAPGPRAPLWALGSLGGGGAASVAGTAFLVVGALPWFSYAGAQERLKAAEAEGSVDVEAAVGAQAAAAREWEGYGRISVGMGAALVGVGVLAVAAGAAGLWLGPDHPDVAQESSE